MIIGEDILVKLVQHFYYKGYKDGEFESSWFTNNEEFTEELNNFMFNNDVQNYEKIL